MSRRGNALLREMHTYARKGGGGFKTVADRAKIAERIADRLIEMNIQIRSVSQMKVRHIELYIESRKTENISKRTLKNEMSAIRNIFAVAGRQKMADPENPRLSNQALDISDASRAGTKIAISDERFLEACVRVAAHDQGVALVMQLSRHLGLRNEEAVQSAKSVKTWQQSLLQGKERVHIVFGTKGGRPRESLVPDKHTALKIVNAAVKYTEENNGRLINKISLSSAKDRYINVVRRIAGLTGQESNHSMRYAYAQEVEKYYLAQGFSEKEARAMTSMDLGHGDGRGDYVKRVYSQKIAEEEI